jgi:hypothetical protein
MGQVLQGSEYDGFCKKFKKEIWRIEGKRLNLRGQNPRPQEIKVSGCSFRRG